MVSEKHSYHTQEHRSHQHHTQSACTTHHDPWEDNLIQLGQCYCYTPFQVIWAWRLLTKDARNFVWSKWEAYAQFTNDIWGVDLRIDGYSLKDFIGIPPFYTLQRFISSSSSLHRIFRFQNFWQPKQQSMNRQQSESPLLLLLLLVCLFHLVLCSTDCSARLVVRQMYSSCTAGVEHMSPLLLLLLLVCLFHLVFYSTDCSAGLVVQKSTADVQKSRASPPCHSFWRLHTAAALQSKSKVQQLFCGVKPKYSRAILLLVVTLLAINQRDAGSWVNQRHQISDVKVLFQIVVNKRHIICDVKVFKHNKNLSANRSILMGVKLSKQC